MTWRLIGYLANALRFSINDEERLELLKDSNTPLPDETIDTNRTITPGGTTLELSHVGLNHSDSTLVRACPSSRAAIAIVGPRDLSRHHDRGSRLRSTHSLEPTIQRGPRRPTATSLPLSHCSYPIRLY
jgi:hypothetical protein